MTDTPEARSASEEHSEEQAIPPSRDAAPERIANRHMGFDTLRTRIGPIDFREVAVWEVKDALEAAYQAGLDAAGSTRVAAPKQPESRRNPSAQ
ncbi:DUF6900 domain-containing protein [Myxococcus xanthus]|uniref:DUF6900 domain-containing protein n=1 Tax=Myxococcus xanthus TaxID=34 RepID=UPI0012FE2F94|nr:hypothetical protein [Myxococcus xanthus]QVW72123.1 hypothetical protein JTM82_13375 [Myxococcus xanthus DZ2]QZZ49351.1 hypothetical protein MyxoNM_09080 [Myxococcus xanthus]UEO08810.1 hypothetical protein K1515_29440 [Myxococcus xanthus DZ2]UYI16435.1 hypothetical protein N3T43_09000 [Myxococcus xanthus]UYI23797.1 hypothetical protein N1129_09000 [Myxococcus xanthus]